MCAKILVVDDIPTNVKLLEARLSAEYHHVISASCGIEAVELARKNRPDIILTDIMMPGMNGIELCKIIRDDPELFDVFIIAITALDQPSDRLEALNAGADIFFIKPVDDVLLMTAIRRMSLKKTGADQLKKLSGNGTYKPDFDQPINVIIIGGADIDLNILFAERRCKFNIRRVESIDQMGESDNFDTLDILIVSERDDDDVDVLRVFAELRDSDQTRDLPVILHLRSDNRAKANRALELGVDDCFFGSASYDVLVAQIFNLVRRKRYLGKLTSGSNAQNKHEHDHVVSFPVLDTQNPTHQETTLFLSYRREDNSHAVGRIYDFFVEHFGPTEVFFDVEDIPAGSEFKKYLKGAIRSTRIFVPIIGQRWADANWNPQKPEVFEDMVTMEFATALEFKKVVLPVLIDGVAMPKKEELPVRMSALTEINAIRVRDGGDFRVDMNLLLKQIEFFLIDDAK